MKVFGKYLQINIMFKKSEHTVSKQRKTLRTIKSIIILLIRTVVSL